jgi:hypothetical protein
MEPMYPVDPVLLEEVPMPPAMHAEARGVIAGRSRNHRVLRSRVLYLFGSTLVVDAVGTVLMYVFEHAKAGSGFEGFGGALFWVSAQLTTVSSQMPNPVTTPGRIVDLVLEVWAISVVATLAASLAAFFHARHIEDIAHHVRDHERRRKPPSAPPV